jgi:hypothetical protein
MLTSSQGLGAGDCHHASRHVNCGSVKLLRIYGAEAPNGVIHKKSARDMESGLVRWKGDAVELAP